MNWCVCFCELIRQSSEINTLVLQVIKNRKIRVDVASGTDNDQDQGMGGGMMGAGRGRGRPSRDDSREDRTPSDWRNAPREMPAPATDRYRSDRGDRGKVLSI